MTPDEGSVSQWLNQLKSGDPDAAQKLWDRYFGRLAGLARLKLRDTPLRTANEEDVAVSAFASFFYGVENGKFPDLNDRDNLWNLLVVITIRKSARFLRRQSQQKRGGDLSAAHVTTRAGLEEILSREPSPEFAAEMAEECRRLLDRLGDPGLETIALWKMEGYTNEEIAAELGCAPRSVERKLRLIRGIWMEEKIDA
jgi:DNA-directed RNA polymerase specialized sigma24 family protein